MRNEAVRLSHAVLAVASVCLVSGFHWLWSLSACNDDSGAPDRTYLDQCWAFDSTRAGWETEAVIVLLGPPALVLLGAVFAGAMRMPALLTAATVVSLTLAGRLLHRSLVLRVSLCSLALRITSTASPTSPTLRPIRRGGRQC